MSQDEKERHVTALRRNTGQSRTLCTRAIEETGNYDDALLWIKKINRLIDNLQKIKYVDKK